MKKSYFLMAAAAALFAACAETDFVNEAAVVEGNAPQAIGFEGFAGKSTRAEIADVEALKGVGVGFKVWGYQGAQALWASGEVVEWNDPAWTYNDTRYWDEKSDYKFGAIAPQSVTGSFSTASKYTITSDIASGPIASATDYLTAAPVTAAKGTPAHGAQVNFSFKHIMSKVTLKLTTSIADVKVTSVTMSGWNNNTATYTDDAWAFNTGALAAPATFVSTETEVPTDANGYRASFLFVPQTADLTFTVNYKIGEMEYNNRVAVVDDQEWLKNEHTVYTLSIGPSAIIFGVNDGLAWDDEAVAAGALQ